MSKSVQNGQKVPRVAKPQKILSQTCFGTPCLCYQPPLPPSPSVKKWVILAEDFEWLIYMMHMQGVFFTGPALKF